MVVAMFSRERGNDDKGGSDRVMREIADSFMKLLALIMVTITLAVSTAAFTMMFG